MGDCECRRQQRFELKRKLLLSLRDKCQSRHIIYEDVFHLVAGNHLRVGMLTSFVYSCVELYRIANELYDYILTFLQKLNY